MCSHLKPLKSIFMFYLLWYLSTFGRILINDTLTKSCHLNSNLLHSPPPPISRYFVSMGNKVSTTYHFHNSRPNLIQHWWLYHITSRMRSKYNHIRSKTNWFCGSSEPLMFYFVRFDNWDENKEHQNIRCYGTSAAACHILFTSSPAHLFIKDGL